MASMRGPDLPAEGGCRCGRVRFRVTAAPLVTMACHCRGCQRMTASACSLSAAFPAESFEVIAGEPVLGGLHGEARHFHCGWCMSWLFTRLPELEWFVNVRATMLDDASWYEPFVESFTSEALPWALVGARYRYAEFPPMEDMEAVLAEYRAASRGAS